MSREGEVTMSQRPVTGLTTFAPVRSTWTGQADLHRAGSPCATGPQSAPLDQAQISTAASASPTPVHARTHSPVVGYLIDKAKDVATAAALTMLHPLTFPQTLLSLAISLGSTGHRVSGSLGFAMYEDAKGLAKTLGNVLQDPGAFTPGFLSFGFGHVSDELFVHEQQHYFQSLVTGPLYLPGLAFEALRATRECGANSTCIHRVSRFEIDAALAERVGPHFPFVDPSVPAVAQGASPART